MGLELEKQINVGFIIVSMIVLFFIAMAVLTMEPTIDDNFLNNAAILTVVYLYGVRAINSRLDGEQVLNLINIVEKSVKERDAETKRAFNLMFGTFLLCKTYNVEYAEAYRANILNFVEEYEMNYLFEPRYV